MAERGKSVFDAPKEKRSMVADILIGAGKGALSNFAGIADLAVMSPTVAYKTLVKGQGMSEAIRGSSGLITNALGLGEPDRNTVEGLAYNLGQVATPMGAVRSKGAYLAETGVNAAANTASSVIEDPNSQFLALTGLMAGSVGGNMIRNRMINQMGFTPEAAAAAQRQGLTLGQSTGNAEALRVESKLAQAPSTADKTAKFFKSQNTAFKSSLDTINNKIMSATAANDTAATRAAFRDLEKTYAGQQAALSAKYGDDIAEAYRINGGETKRFASMKTVLETLDSLIQENKTLSGTGIDKAVVKELETMKRNFEGVKGKFFTMEEFVKEYKNWTKKSYTNQTFVDGLNADSSKAINAAVAKAFEETLDDVVKNPANLVNSKAAQKLIETRAAYQQKKQEMNDWAATPVNKLFNVDNVYALDGEQVVEAIGKMKPESRSIAINYLNAISPDITLAVRRKILDDLVSTGIETGRGTVAAGFNSNAFLKGVEERMKTDPHLLDFLFMNPKDKAEFTSRVEAAKKMANTSEVARVVENKDALNAVGELGSLVGGYQTRVATRGISGALTDTASAILLPKDKLFDMLFKGQDIRKGLDTAVNRGLAKSMVSANTDAARQQRVNEETQAATEQLLAPPEDQPEEDLSYEAFLRSKEAAKGQQGEGVAPSESIPAPQPMEQSQQAPMQAPMQPVEEDLSYEAYLRSKKGMR